MIIIMIIKMILKIILLIINIIFLYYLIKNNKYYKINYSNKNIKYKINNPKL